MVVAPGQTLASVDAEIEYVCIIPVPEGKVFVVQLCFPVKVSVPEPETVIVVEAEAVLATVTLPDLLQEENS